MARCGCDSAIVIKPGCGIRIDGTGEPEDPYVISVDPCALAGEGLRVEGGDGCKLAAASAAPPGDSTNPASITRLSDRAPCANIVGAYLGGYLYRPQSTRASIQTAVDRGYDLLHLPVRYLRDGTPVITPDPMLGRQNGNKPDAKTQDTTPARWGDLPNKAGGREDPVAGWFGYTAPTEEGLVTLVEALNIINNRIPAVLDLQWPLTRGDDGAPTWAPGQETPPERVDAFLRQVKGVIDTQAAAENVIVTTSHPKVPVPDGERDVLKEVGTPHTGITLATPEAADGNKPDTGQQNQQEQDQEPQQ